MLLRKKLSHLGVVSCGHSLFTMGLTIKNSIQTDCNLLLSHSEDILKWNSLEMLARKRFQKLILVTVTDFGIVAQK